LTDRKFEVSDCDYEVGLRAHDVTSGYCVTISSFIIISIIIALVVDSHRYSDPVHTAPCQLPLNSTPRLRQGKTVFSLNYFTISVTDSLSSCFLPLPVCLHNCLKITIGFNVYFILLS